MRFLRVARGTASKLGQIFLSLRALSLIQAGAPVEAHREGKIIVMGVVEAWPAHCLLMHPGGSGELGNCADMDTMHCVSQYFCKQCK